MQPKLSALLVQQCPLVVHTMIQWPPPFQKLLKTFTFLPRRHLFICLHFGHKSMESAVVGAEVTSLNYLLVKQI